MERRVVHTDKVPPARVPLSQAIQAGEWVFASGQLGMDLRTGRLAAGGIKAETRQVCENLKAVLEAAGSSLTIGNSIRPRSRFAEAVRREGVWRRSGTAHNRPYVHPGFLLPGR